MTISELLDQYEPQLAAAFQRAIDEITSQAQIGQIVEALERGDIDGAIRAVYVDEAAFREFERVLQDTYIAAADKTISDIDFKDAQGNPIIVRFNSRNLFAEQFLREVSSDLVTAIVMEQRTIIREFLSDGISRGDNPTTTALNIVGRIDRRTGRREGGIIGLSIPFENAARRARDELTEGDYSAYFQRTKRDKRFDRTIAKAEKDGKPLTASQIDKIIGRYRDRLLKLRGNTIGRTETHRALNRGQYEALLNEVRSGTLQANQIKRIWDATGDSRTRLTHMFAEGQEVGLEEDFQVGASRLRYPGDQRGEAKETINCRCIVRIDVDFLAGVD